MWFERFLFECFAASMPLMVNSTDRDRYFIVLINEKHKSYKLLGYSGVIELTDLSNVIMNLTGGHMVSLPGASGNCFYVSTTVAWII